MVGEVSANAVEMWASLVKGMHREAFLSRYGATRFLLVRLRKLEGELVEGLRASLTGRHRPPKAVLRYETQVSSKELLRRAQALGRFTEDSLATELRGGSYFAIPVQKRAGVKSFTKRISVGRAPNNDIILRDESVSKFHAWFERDDNDAYYVGAAETTNPTLLNGETVARESVAIEDGDRLHFGSIETLCTTAATFYDGATLTLAHPKGDG